MPASDATSRAAVAATTPAEELYYVSLNSVTDVVVTDDQGNSTAITADGYRGEVPYVTQYNINDIQTDVLLPISGNYSITFRSKNTLPQISIRQGTGDTTTRSIRYLDAATPPNTAGQLVFGAQGPAPTTYDQDGDGSYETPVMPDVDLSGPAAADQRGPTIQFTTGAQGSSILVTILASDSESGVKTTRYSIDGRMYQVYSAPFTVDPTQVTNVSAFSGDNAGNRSGLYEVAISGGNTLTVHKSIY